MGNPLNPEQIVRKNVQDSLISHEIYFHCSHRLKVIYVIRSGLEGIHGGRASLINLAPSYTMYFLPNFVVLSHSTSYI